MRLSDAGLRQRPTKLIYSNHRPPPCLTEDAPPRSLEPIVMCCPSRRAETPWDFESTQLPNQHRVLASRGDGQKVVQRGFFAERWLRETRGILRTEQIAPHRPATAKNRAAIYSTLQPAKCFLQALRISSACASTRCCAARICWSRQAVIVRQRNGWLKPELSLTVRTLHMDVHPGLFSREKVKSKASIAENCGTH